MLRVAVPNKGSLNGPATTEATTELLRLDFGVSKFCFAAPHGVADRVGITAKPETCTVWLDKPDNIIGHVPPPA